MKIIATAIILTLIAVLGYGGAYAYSASKITIQKVQMNELQSITAEGFSVTGTITMANGGIVGVTVKNITYSIVIEATNQTIASGIVRGARIPAKGTVNFSIENAVAWIPSTEGVLQLLEPGDTHLTIKGNAIVSRFNIHIPFETRINIEQYLKQFVQKKAEELLDTFINKLGSFLTER